MTSLPESDITSTAAVTSRPVHKTGNPRKSKDRTQLEGLKTGHKLQTLDRKHENIVLMLSMALI